MKSTAKGIITRHKPYVRIENATSGITLIALVITIIILLILVGVVLNLALGENGIIKFAESARKNYLNATEQESNELAKIDDYINIEEKNEIFAEEVFFVPTDTNWNVENVKEALDYLYTH